MVMQSPYHVNANALPEPGNGSCPLVNFGWSSWMRGLAAAIAVFAVGATSGAHINPAVTLGMAVFRGFAWRKVIPYVVAQIIGAFLAAATVYLAWHGVITSVETTNNLTRGADGSQNLAMIFHTFTPNPAVFGATAAGWDTVPLWTGFVVEVVATALLVTAVMFFTDALNTGRPLANLAPWFIGLVITVLVIFAGPLTMAALNPARDFGPRLFAFVAGWGDIAIPGPRGEMWIPIAGPLVGGLLGGGVYTYLLAPFYPLTAEPGLLPPEADMLPTDDQ